MFSTECSPVENIVKLSNLCMFCNNISSKIIRLSNKESKTYQNKKIYNLHWENLILDMQNLYSQSLFVDKSQVLELSVHSEF